MPYRDPAPLQDARKGSLLTHAKNSIIKLSISFSALARLVKALPLPTDPVYPILPWSSSVAVDCNPFSFEASAGLVPGLLMLYVCRYETRIFHQPALANAVYYNA